MLDHRMKLHLSESLEYFKEFFVGIFKINLILLFFFTLVRGCFFLSYAQWDQLKNYGLDVIHAFLLGIRFDLVVVAYANALPFLVLLFLPFFANNSLWKKFRNGLILYYISIVIFYGFIAGVDYGYYSYFQDHLNIILFGFLDDDTLALVKTFWQNYPVVFLILGYGIFVYSFSKLIANIFSHINLEVNYCLPRKRSGLWKKALLLPLVFSVNSLVARGTLALFPLTVSDATISTNGFVNKLSINGVMSFYNAVKERRKQNHFSVSNIEAFGYSDDIRRAFRDYLGREEFKVKFEGESFNKSDLLSSLLRTTTQKKSMAESPVHVIVIVMESFGSYWLNFHDSKTFDLLGDLEKHFKEDLLFTNFLSSHVGTLGSLTSLVSGLPRRPYGAFLPESEFVDIPLQTATAKPFKEKGYHRLFVYGGNIGWRNINKFLPKQDFETIEGDRVIKEFLAKDDRNLEKEDAWGVYDEFFFKYLYKRLEKADRPMFIMALSTTNHPPYALPEHYHRPEQRIPEKLMKRLIVNKDLVKGRFQSYRYSNHFLGKFISSIKNSPLGEKTIIAVTGDHGFNIINFSDEELLEKYGVPLYLYIPPSLRPENVNTRVFGSHKDIAPTLFNLALSEQDYFSVGSDLLNKDDEHFSVNANFVTLNQLGGVKLSNNSQISLYSRNGKTLQRIDPNLTTAESKEQVLELEELAKKYRAIMSVTDRVLWEERRKYGKTIRKK